MQSADQKLQVVYDFVPTGSKVTIEQEKQLFCFEANGAKQTYNISSTVILDVGNELAPGVIDVHHIENGFEWQNEQIVSSSKLLYKFPGFLDNISPEEELVTIIVHANPDFDCFASAFLTEYYLRNKTFPAFAEELVEYAEQIDSGRLKLNPNQVFTPYSISLVISETVNRKNFSDFFDFQNAYMKKGLELIDYIVTRLPQLTDSERTIDSPTLFRNGHPFQQEKKMIEEDYRKYQTDLHSICEKQKVRLTRFDGSITEVDGLFWNAPSTAFMDKLWARTDKSSPSGTGYIFTFIPQAVIETSAEVLGRFAEESMEVRRAILTTNRVIISVDGNSDVTLMSLGELLELAESSKEERLFGASLMDKWRSRDQNNRRFKEQWADNADPWYDGRNNKHQIVDAPKIGSLLTLLEIKEVLINYTKPKVKECQSRVLYPFHFHPKNFQNLLTSIADNPKMTKVNHRQEKQLVNYFRPYIREYLFNADNDKNGYSYEFVNADTYSINLSEQNGKIISGETAAAGNSGLADGISVDIRETTVSLFRYGIGFIVVDLDIVTPGNEELLFDLYLEINQALCESEHGKDLILTQSKELLKESVPFIQEYEDGLIYSSIVIQDKNYLDSEKKELVYKLCSQSEWNSSFDRDTKHMTNLLDRMYYDLNDSMVMGFSKKGGVLVVFEKDTRKLTDSQLANYMKEIERETHNFITSNYYIFLLVVQQRYGLMNFSKELSEIGIKGKVKKISKLKDVVFEFITQGWFSQITNDENGMDIYKKWMDIFESQTIHDEVIEQVSTIEEHQKAKSHARMNSSFTIVSSLFLIIAGITGFFGMNIPIVATFTDQTALVFSVYFCAVVIGIWLFLFLANWISGKWSR